LYIVPIAQASDKLITQGSRSPAKRDATAGDPEVDLTSKAPSRAVDYSASILVTQRSAKLGRPTSEKGEELLFENTSEELEYLWCE
jgi:hypothetical protein